MPPRRPFGPPSGPARSHGYAAPQPDLFDADEDELVAGRRPVEEAFVARRETRRLLVVPQRRQALEKIVLHATSLRIPIVEVEGGTLTALAGFDGHQGVAVVVAPRRYADVDEILARAVQREESPFVLVLDSLEDPQNVGSLLRSAEAAGTHGVIFPTHRQAPLTPSAIKASAGAVEHLLLAPVDDLAGALAELHGRGLRIVGADAEAALTVREADLRGPIALVVGSEGQGLGPAVRRRCDLMVRIPMRGAVGSLNASVAGSILLYEATTQRGGASEPPRDSREPTASAELEHPTAEDATVAAAGVESPPAARRVRRGKVTAEPIGVPETAEPAEPAPTHKRTRRRVAMAATTEPERPKEDPRLAAPVAAEPEPEPAPAPRRTRPRAVAVSPSAEVQPGPSAGSSEALLPGDSVPPTRRSPRTRLG